MDDVDGHVPLLQLVGNEIPSLNPDLPENINNGLGVGLGLFNKSNHQDIASNFRDFFCRRCLRYACLLHRIQQPLPRHRIDPKPPFLSKVGKFILPSDLIRDHRRPVSVLADSSKGMLLTQQGGDLMEARHDEPKCNFLLSNGTNHGHGANLNSGSKHRSVANRSIDAEGLEGAVYYNCFEDRVPKDELNPNNFYFTDFMMIYMSPTTKIDEIFVPSTTLASFPTLLQSIHDGINVHSTMETSSDGALMLSHHEESSGSSIDAGMNNYGDCSLVLDNELESRDSWIPSKEYKSPEQFQAVKSLVQSYFKSKIPLHNIQKIDKSAPSRVGKNSSFVAPQSSILDTSRPLTDRQKVKEKFDPPLTDVEIGIISHLCHMFAFYRPYKTGDTPNVSEVASPVHSFVDMQSTSINSDPTSNPSAENIHHSNYLVQFVYNILATRSKTEILEILSEHHVLFPKHQIEQEEDRDHCSHHGEGKIEVEDLLLNDDPHTLEDHEDEGKFD